MEKATIQSYLYSFALRLMSDPQAMHMSGKSAFRLSAFSFVGVATREQRASTSS
jgi:hypothetical protein